MVNCRGCGREIDISDLDSGNKYLCERCLYEQVAGRETGRPGSYKLLLSVVYGFLAALGLAGIALCILYLVGVASFGWFLILLLLLLAVVIIPAAVLARRRNLALILAAFYLPLGVWTYLWYLAPGINWDRGNVILWGSFLFLFVGLLSTYLFVRDIRLLQRI
jgi:hypothetical protein